jgi:site-specific DNA recombinase
MTEENGGARTTVLYARVSTKGQADEGYSLRQQIEALRRWAEAEGCEVLAAVEDVGHSGAGLERWARP